MKWPIGNGGEGGSVSLPTFLLFFFSYTRLKSVVASYAETEFRSFFLLLKIVARTYILQAVVLFSFKVRGMGLGEVLYCIASRLFMHISQM